MQIFLIEIYFHTDWPNENIIDSYPALLSLQVCRNRLLKSKATLHAAFMLRVVLGLVLFNMEPEAKCNP